MTIAESKNDSLGKEKGELEGAIKSMKSVKSESGKKSCYVFIFAVKSYSSLSNHNHLLSGYKTKFVRFAPDTATESDSDSDHVSDTCLSRVQGPEDTCLYGKFSHPCVVKRQVLSH